MEDLIPHAGGSWRCRFRERDLFDTEPSKHLNPYYQEGKRHRQYRDMGHNAVNDSVSTAGSSGMRGWRSLRACSHVTSATRRGMVQCSMKVDTCRPTRTGTACPLGFGGAYAIRSGGVAQGFRGR